MALLKLLLAFLIILGILYIFVRTAIYSHRNFVSYFRKNYVSIPIQIAFAIVNCLISFLLSSFRWSWSETQQFNGLPIPWAAWEFTNGTWLDFISPVSVIVWGLDFIIWMGFFYSITALIFYFRSKRTSAII